MVRMIGYQLNLHHKTVHEILMHDLKMHKICAKIVPKTLTQEQKDNQKMCVLSTFLSALKMAQFYETYLTGDESWIFLYDPETKWQSEEWHTKDLSLIHI